MSFTDYELDPRLLKTLDKQQITEPTPVQEQTIPVALTGRDLVAIAQTGTGKTLAFALPSLTCLGQGTPKRNQMLVLVPTRELAVQVNEVIENLGRTMGIRSTAIYGGVSLDRQAEQLRRGSTVIVATPGRLLDHLGRGTVRLGELAILVLDEADRMLDMGFMPDLQRILAKLPKDRQTLMTSATFPDEIAYLSREMLNNPERITVGSVAKPVDKVRQILYPVHHGEKLSLLMEILGSKEKEIGSALVFLRTKHRTDRLAQTLKKAGFPATTIHGDCSQRQRELALKGFRSGKFSILVATDVAARGLDVDGISHVFNYDIPPNSEDYVHRVGRTARAEAEGDAITFVCPDEHLALYAIEKSLGKNLPRAEREGAPSVLSLFHERGSKAAPRKSSHRRAFARRR
ncbi:MAG: DEAD/DEAH box helicase [FCB group bacterium]|jgi:ATP-dependent RNA helicase RhlE|nr:DEAD/DEAH box helicase [FCB group bacterium]